jgi:hypothetical protein
VFFVSCPDREDPATLRRCYESVLSQLAPLNARTVVLTPLGMDGRFDLPPIPSTHVALACVRKFLDSAENSERARGPPCGVLCLIGVAQIDMILFAVATERHMELYRALLHDYFPPEEPPPPPPPPPPPVRSIVRCGG